MHFYRQITAITLEVFPVVVKKLWWTVLAYFKDYLLDIIGMHAVKITSSYILDGKTCYCYPLDFIILLSLF